MSVPMEEEESCHQGWPRRKSKWRPGGHGAAAGGRARQGGAEAWSFQGRRGTRAKWRRRSVLVAGGQGLWVAGGAWVAAARRRVAGCSMEGGVGRAAGGREGGGNWGRSRLGTVARGVGNEGGFPFLFLSHLFSLSPIQQPPLFPCPDQYPIENNCSSDHTSQAWSMRNKATACQSVRANWCAKDASCILILFLFKLWICMMCWKMDFG